MLFRSSYSRLSFLICILIEAAGELEKNKSDDAEHLSKEHGRRLAIKKEKKDQETKKLNENDDKEHPSEKNGGSPAIKSSGKEQQMTLHLKERMVEENPAALRLPGGVLGGLHVGQLDEHLVQHIKMVRKKTYPPT